MPRVLLVIGDATEVLDTLYPFFRLPEDGFEVVVAGPQAPLAAAELTAHVKEFGDKLGKRWSRARPDIAHAQSWTSGLSVFAAARGSETRESTGARDAARASRPSWRFRLRRAPA